MRKEYPPILSGRAEEQIGQLRAYLLRLLDDLDESLASSPAGEQAARQAALAEWQLSVDAALSSLRGALRGAALVQHGAAAQSGRVRFPRPFAGVPAIFATAGAVAEADETGFTLTTTAPAQWIAVGDRR